MRPNLRQVERIDRVVRRRLLRHDLDIERPTRKLTALDAVEKVAVMTLAVFANHGPGFLIRQVLDTLVGFECEFHPEALVIGVDEAEGVAAEPMHVTEASGNTSLALDDGDLMERLGQQGPEIPVALRTPHTGSRIAFDGVVEIRKTQRIAEEENRGVIPDKIPITLFGVEFEREAANISLGIGGATLSSNRRKAGEHLGPLADLENIAALV